MKRPPRRDATLDAVRRPAGAGKPSTGTAAITRPTRRPRTSIGKTPTTCKGLHGFISYWKPGTLSPRPFAPRLPCRAVAAILRQALDSMLGAAPGKAVSAAACERERLQSPTNTGGAITRAEALPGHRAIIEAPRLRRPSFRQWPACRAHLCATRRAHQRCRAPRRAR